ncbi:MAG: thiamine phosphate synthase [Candidatus Dormibacteria bacterium]
MSQAKVEPDRLVSGGDRRARLRASRLYLVTDDGTPAEALPGLIAGALGGGVDVVQLRRKGVAPEELLALAVRCREVCHAAGALFVVDDHVDLALEAAADGVHLGQEDTPVAEARSRLGGEFLIGWSTHDGAQVRAAAGLDVDYIAAGPVHETPTKAGRSAVGFEHVELAARGTTVPVVAIGGLDATDAATAVEAGADLVAVVRAICASPDPRAAARAIRTRIDGACAWSWIEVNGETRKCRRRETLQGLVEGLRLDPTALVIERNGTIVDRKQWGATELSEGDRLELVHFVGGG